MKTKTKIKRKLNKIMTNKRKEITILLLTATACGIIGYTGQELTKSIQAEPTTVNVPKAHIEPHRAKNEIQEFEEVARFEADVTSYSEIDSCHYPNCAMASGKRAYVGAIACPREILLGTRVMIDNTPYICEDRTSIIYNGRFDIFQGYGEESYLKAKQYGIQKKEVIIYKRTNTMEQGEKREKNKKSL